MQWTFYARYFDGAFKKISNNRTLLASGYGISKTLLIMKLMSILLLATCMQLTAEGLAQSVTISVKDAPLAKVFKQITSQTGYEFLYNDRLLKTARPITVKMVGASLQELLDACFKDQPLAYTITNNTIVIRALELKKNSANMVNQLPLSLTPTPIRGQVKTSDNKPLAGATVALRGGVRNTMTDDNGEFVIEANPGQVLVVSYVGFESQEVVVKSGEEGARMSIVLMPGTKAQDTAVVSSTITTGYQKVSKERYVGSFSQLDSANFHRREGMGIVERLDGTVPGIVFNKKGLTPTVVRGLSTLGRGGVRNEPLIIVDNFPYQDVLSTINPNDVESMTVLKDAAATSIWGSQAGNGVIVITTKRGKYNQPLKVSFRSNAMLTQKPNLFFYPRLGSADIIEVERMLYEKGAYTTRLADLYTFPEITPVVEILEQIRLGRLPATEGNAQIEALKSQDVRHDLDEYVYRPGINQQHYLNVSGGNNLLNYVLSAGYNVTQPNIQHSRSGQEFTINSKNSFKPFTGLEVIVGLTINQRTSFGTGFSDAPGLLYTRLADASGKALPVSKQWRMAALDTAGKGQLLDWHFRPLDEIRFANSRTENKSLRLNIDANYRIMPWLTAGVQYALFQVDDEQRNLQSQQAWSTRNLINTYTDLSRGLEDPLRYPIPLGGVLDLSTTKAHSYFYRSQLNVNKNFGSQHALTGFVAGEVSNTVTGERTSSTLYGYDENTNTSATLIDYNTRFRTYFKEQREIPTDPSPYDAGYTKRYISYIGNLSYTYDGRITVYASGRRDGSNLFGVNTNNRWKPLWSVGSRWDLTKERFYNIPWASALALRASYGYSGNTVATSAHPTIGFERGPGGQGYGLPTAPLVGRIAQHANPDLRWEEVKTINVGIDFRVLNNRLSGSLDVYQKRSLDVIDEIPPAPAQGAFLVTVNSASLKGSGFELVLQSQNIRRELLEWSSSMNLSRATAIVTKVYDGRFKASDFIEYGLTPSVGRPAYSIAAYRWAGLDASGAPQGVLGGHISKDYGQIFSDEVNNQLFLGSSTPIYSSNLLNTFSYGNWSLSANITGRFGFYFRKPTINYLGFINGISINHPDFWDRWQQPGDEAHTSIPAFTYPQPTDADARDRFFKGAAINVLKGDNIRLQDIRLQYAATQKGSGSFPFKSWQISLYINQLNKILWRADDSPYDPEFAGGVLPDTAPPEIQWTLGIGANF